MAEGTAPSWYDLAAPTDPLEQGDLFERFPVIVPDLADVGVPLNDADALHDLELKLLVEIWPGVVVLTQTCDLARAKLRFVLVALVTDLDALAAENEAFRKRQLREQIAKRLHPSYFPLFPGGELEAYKVVDMRQLVSVPMAWIRKFATDCGPRLRLLSPYREALAQHFAQHLSRIALAEPPQPPGFAA